MSNQVASASSASGKTVSLCWVFLAYLCSIGLAALYLYLPQWAVLRSGEVLLDTFIADLLATLVIFIFSRTFNNSSFYDAYWSVIPPLIFHHWLALSGKSFTDPLVWMLGAVIWLWAIRLTWNWVKYWTGLNHEDWRYELLRSKAPRGEFFIDFFAIHFFPTLQVFLGLLPVYACLFYFDGSVTIAFYVVCILGLLAPLIQWVADRQLHDFIAVRKEGEIICKGLWSWSRHPNYFGELLFWFSLGSFGLLCHFQGFLWVMSGFLAMLFMFLFASIPMMEQRSLERRPQYQHIINTTSMIFPWPPKK